VRNASNDFTFDSVSRLWTFQLLGFEVVQVRLQKKPLQLFSIEIQKGAIFDRFKIKISRIYKWNIFETFSFQFSFLFLQIIGRLHFCLFPFSLFPLRNNLQNITFFLRIISVENRSFFFTPVHILLFLSFFLFFRIPYI
jgi:hypothetical protein